MLITLERLRAVLGDKMGSVITPELAASILCTAIDRDERAIDPQRFAPRSYGDIVFHAESFRDILIELDRLHRAHYRETELHLDGFALKPDYDYMAERERTGSLIQFTARDVSGLLIGNLRMYLAPSRHTGHLVAEEDTFYLMPAWRQGMNALAFMRYAEDMLAAVLQVVELRTTTKVVNRAGQLMQRRGFAHVANQFVKFLADGAGHRKHQQSEVANVLEHAIP